MNDSNFLLLFNYSPSFSNYCYLKFTRTVIRVSQNGRFYLLESCAINFFRKRGERFEKSGRRFFDTDDEREGERERGEESHFWRQSFQQRRQQGRRQFELIYSSNSITRKASSSSSSSCSSSSSSSRSNTAAASSAGDNEYGSKPDCRSGAFKQ